MKIRLFVEDEAFIIEECEGEPEIRLESEPKSAADDRAHAFPKIKPSPLSTHQHIGLRVERAD